MRIAQGEIFGPVICVIDYDAVNIANDSAFGLSGAVSGETSAEVAPPARGRPGGDQVIVQTPHHLPTRRIPQRRSALDSRADTRADRRRRHGSIRH
jgi:hypothetical protein